MNGLVISNTISSVTFKLLVLEENIGLWEWLLLRNLLIFILALIGLASKRINLFKVISRAQWGVLFGLVEPEEAKVAAEKDLWTVSSEL